eukprot:scaffold4871_cov116-Skeletonema_marinoi.AAC.3
MTYLWLLQNFGPFQHVKRLHTITVPTCCSKALPIKASPSAMLLVPPGTLSFIVSGRHSVTLALIKSGSHQLRDKPFFQVGTCRGPSTADATMSGAKLQPPRRRFRSNPQSHGTLPSPLSVADLHQVATLADK